MVKRTNHDTRELLISPTHCITGNGALRGVGAITRRYGERVMIIHGTVGYPKVEDTALSSMIDAGVNVVLAPHTGPCTREAIATHAQVAISCSAEVVLGIGGGRVLDTAKGVADAVDLPCITVPTSPATCAATTALVVLYDSASAYTGSRLSREPPIAAIVDSDIMAHSPDRLLVAGVVDAMAKHHEVRLAAGRAGTRSATSLAALTLCDGLEALLTGVEAVLGEQADERNVGQVNDRAAIAEAVLLWPGLIGGLAGEASKLAAAHAIHNALTLLPGSKRSLHGEILAFGILVQMKLEGERLEALQAKAHLFAKLGCPCSLEALGCSAFYSGEGRKVVSRAITLPSMKRSFPDISEQVLRKVMAEVDGIASDATASVR